MSYYELDEFDDVVSSLALLEKAIDRDDIAKLDVKWAIIAAHSALQGACVCLLTRTDGGGAFQSGQPGTPNDHEGAWLTYLNHGSQKEMCEAAGIEWILPDPKPPKPRLASLRELAKRLPDNLRFTVAKKGKWPADLETQDFTRLILWRNEFAHYSAKTWMIELAGVPRVLLRAVERIEKIAKEGNFKRINRFRETDFFPLVERIQQKLKNLQDPP